MPAAPSSPASLAGTASAPRLIESLRRRLDRRRTVDDVLLEIPGAGGPYVIAQPANPDGVLDEITNATAADLHMPYWATLWASGLALAEVVLARRDELSGRRVLELGCGLGTTATALVEAGARLDVADCFAETLAYARYNCLRNTGTEVRGVLADWRVAEGQERLLAAMPFDAVLAADVLYEVEDIAPLLDLVPRLISKEGTFWLAEPGRATSTKFVEQAEAAGWARESVAMERIWPAGVGYANVRVHLFQPH